MWGSRAVAPPLRGVPFPASGRCSHGRPRRQALLPVAARKPPDWGCHLTWDWRLLRRPLTGQHGGGTSVAGSSIVTRAGMSRAGTQSKRAALWEEMYQVLADFQTLHGHCQVPQCYPDNQQLGPWVNRQRQQHRMGKLPEKRTASLEALGFQQASPNILWEQQLELLAAFQKIHRHCRVPQRYPDNPQLGKWVNTQRLQYRNGKLSKERIACLEDLGFEWAPGIACSDKQWEEKYK